MISFSHTVLLFFILIFLLSTVFLLLFLFFFSFLCFISALSFFSCFLSCVLSLLSLFFLAFFLSWTHSFILLRLILIHPTFSFFYHVTIQYFQSRDHSSRLGGIQKKSRCVWFVCYQVQPFYYCYCYFYLFYSLKNIYQYIHSQKDEYKPRRRKWLEGCSYEYWTNGWTLWCSILCMAKIRRERLGYIYLSA
jgi:energy-coupling factor transporter transmembrane protein EcfT